MMRSILQVILFDVDDDDNDGAWSSVSVLRLSAGLTEPVLIRLDVDSKLSELLKVWIVLLLLLFIIVNIMYIIVAGSERRPQAVGDGSECNDQRPHRSSCPRMLTKGFSFPFPSPSPPPLLVVLLPPPDGRQAGDAAPPAEECLQAPGADGGVRGHQVPRGVPQGGGWWSGWWSGWGSGWGWVCFK